MATAENLTDLRELWRHTWRHLRRHGNRLNECLSRCPAALARGHDGHPTALTNRHVGNARALTNGEHLGVSQGPCAVYTLEVRQQAQ